AAFTVRQTIFAPIDDPAIVMLLDVETTLPMTVTTSFRPRLRLMWPAPSMTGNIGWDRSERVYYVTEETGRYAGVIGCPVGNDVSVMPYQEEPRDVPNRFVVQASPDEFASELIPIIVTGSVEGRAAAKASYDRVLAAVR